MFLTACSEEGKQLNSLMNMAGRIDAQLRSRSRCSRRSSFPRPVMKTPGPSSAEAEPMQLGRRRVLPEEREHHLDTSACFYCG